MFTKSALSASVLALASTAAAGPVRRQLSSSGIASVFYMPETFNSESSTVSSFGSSHSFDGWGGLSALNGFDSWFGGADNFCGSSNVQTFSQETVVQCQSIDITIIQQQLSILLEYAKEIITTQICEVETQTIVSSQCLAVFESFSEDIRHVSGRTATYDHHIASFISSCADSNGIPIMHDFGFTGTEIGAQSVTIEGCNWNDQTSHESVSSAWQACLSSSSVSISPPTTSSIESLCGSSGCPYTIPPTLTPSCVGSSCTSPPTIISSDCGSSDCGSSSISTSLPSSSECTDSSCGSSSTFVPPTSISSCSDASCEGSSSTFVPPTSGSSCTDSSCIGSSSSGSFVPPSSLPPSSIGSSCTGSECPIAGSAPIVGTDGSLAPTDGIIGTDGSVAAPTGVIVGTDGSAAPTDGVIGTDGSVAPTGVIVGTDGSVAPTGVVADGSAPTDTAALSVPTDTSGDVSSIPSVST